MPYFPTIGPSGNRIGQKAYDAETGPVPEYGNAVHNFFVWYRTETMEARMSIPMRMPSNGIF